MLNETFVLNMDGQEVTVTFLPNDESPFRKTDAGVASINIDGSARSYPYVKTSFVPLPFKWPK